MDLRWLLVAVVAMVVATAPLPPCQNDQLYSTYFDSVQSHKSLLPCMRAANMTDKVFLQLTLMAPTRAQVTAFFASADCKKVFDELMRVYRDVFPSSCAFNSEGLDVKELGKVTFAQLQTIMLNATSSL
ncbi:hypothetical protein ACHHYP_08883 [Achlya hypogyna]|uniref:Secreted protein n=1 Tax=Achlya hypogyna TaxID=1202772 RepID=A0A0A7CNX6_ACHHY|nr:secreted protein [Achlya hypogyna]OQR87422.1 hypothetical protein ACHHYP_08883 [Achlya hypogyna]